MKFCGKDPMAVSVAKELGVTEAELALQWSLTSGFCTIPKSLSHIEDNFAVAGRPSLSDDVMKRLGACDQGWEASQVVRQMLVDPRDVM